MSVRLVVHSCSRDSAEVTWLLAEGEGPHLSQCIVHGTLPDTYWKVPG